MTSRSFNEWMKVFHSDGDCSGSWEKEYYTSEIRITVEKTPANVCVQLRSRPTHDGYAMVVDVKINAGKKTKLVEGELWEQERLLTQSFPPSQDEIQVSLRTRQLVSVFDTHRSFGSRTHAVLITGDPVPFYVDPAYMADLGGQMFAEWKEGAQAGIERVAVSDLNPPLLQPLIKAVCGYSEVLIHRDNLIQLLEAGREYGVVGVLHEVEGYLLDSEMNPILKLEYAMNCKMGRLYDDTKMGSTKEILSHIHEHLQEQGGTLADMNPELMEALGLRGEAFCLNDI